MHGLRHPQRRDAVLRLTDDLEPFALEQASRAVSEGRMVIDDEDGCRRSAVQARA
jgi:hypothetical protein